MGFWAALYYTITMILDAGCIESVVQDIGTAGVMLDIVCLIVVIIGTITFTGAVIGTFTNTLSGFIEKSNSGSRKLYISDHLVILNWKSRASEIINDLLYAKKVSAFFNEIPPACTSGQLIRAVWDATKDWHPTVVLGYVKPGNIVRLFSGDQDEETVELRPEDKLIVFTDH